MNVEALGRELAARLVLSRPLVCLDLETTGIRVEHDRIVQIAAASIFPDGQVTTWSSLVNPGQPIPPAATAIHGISDEMASCAPTFTQLAPTVGALLSGCDLAGYNVERFDRRMLVNEFLRLELEDPTIGARIVDVYTLFVRQEPRSLDAALRFYGVPGQANRRAHEASSDVEATVAVLLAQLKSYGDVPTSIGDLHDWLWPGYPNRIDGDGKLAWCDGVATVAFGAQAGRSLADLAASDRGFLEWMLRRDFSAEVRTIVRDALAGRFPVRAQAQPL
jgi:DNA polymerase-3 subunit epsilon